MAEISKGYSRVTEILYPFSGLEKIDPAVVSNAAQRGTRVHHACEAIANGLGDWFVEDDIRGYVDSFKQWWHLGHSVIAIEQRFYCSELMITGQVDFVLQQENGAVILDLKTPMRPSKTWPLQGSAYAYMARQSGYNITGIHFLQLNKHGKKPKLHVYDDKMEMFLKCLDVYNHFFRKRS